MNMERPEQPVIPEADILLELMDEHDRVRRILDRRKKNAQHVTSLWADGDVSELLETLDRLGDEAVTADFLRNLRQDRRSTFMTLDLCMGILPLVRSGLRSRCAEIARVSLQSTDFMLQTFAGIITQTRAVAANRNDRAPVDFSLDERIRKCEVAHRLFRDIWDELEAGKPAMQQLAATRKDVCDAVSSFVNSA
jgi:hypothetical protein